MNNFKLINKIIISVVIFISIIIGWSIKGFASTSIDSVYLTQIGIADNHLKYYREDRGIYTHIVSSIVGHNENGVFYPAYCMNKDLNGAEVSPYTVNISEILNNDALWRVIKNGYPYKSAVEMGLYSDFDAYTVTKMAVYCILRTIKFRLLFSR